MASKAKRNHVKKVSSLITVADPSSMVSEQFKTLRTNIQFAMIDKKMKSLVIASAAPHAGKSTVASNLAVTFAMQGLNVLLVDTDLRRPTLQKFFNVPNVMGLTNLLTNTEADIEEYVVKTPSNGLYLLTSGPVPPNPSELLGSDRMQQLQTQLENQFDLVIFDTPPLLGFTDGQILAGRADGTIFVAHHGVAKKENMLKSNEVLKMVNANVLGVVYNQVPLSDIDNNYYYYYSEED
ncbi:CpsD/CapB family tyrosine-protein kinase [Jeotgalibaca sp. A122]|uniref:CpsD/CapB family tyrosine-protein kinase n=1 Tax=Jeotgalibaca sp. A122 TaxID=3457322 RepID=UPI003FD373FB